MAAPEDSGAGRRIRTMNHDPAPAQRRPPPAFSDELHTLAERFGRRPVKLRVLFEATRRRGLHLLLLLVALPFVGPVPLPGFSIPFGLVVAVIGLRLALGARPWLPSPLLQCEISPHVVTRALAGTSRLMKTLEHYIHPRLPFIYDHPVFDRIAGLLIGVSGLFLILPLPLPFSNSLPAWTIIFLSAGALGRDGLFFVAGCASFSLSVAYFTLVFWGGEAAIRSLLPA